MNSQYWWTEKRDDAHRAVLEYVRGLEETQKWVHQQNLNHARLYANCDLAGLDWTLSHRTYARRPLGRVTENVIQSVIDTATAMIAKNRPRATFLTDGADFATQQKAKALGRFVEGTFQRTDVYAKAQMMFRDACVFGTGALKVYEEDGEVCVERPFIGDIVVDEMESRSCEPRQMHHRRFVDREGLKALFPKFAKEIDEAHRREGGQTWTSYRQIPQNQVAVVESWHLPSGKKAKDGRHSIAIEGATLEWEDWKKDCFPFVFYRWSTPLVGFYGQGLAEQLVGIQLRLNKLNRFIEDAQDLIAVPRIFVEMASKVLRSQFTNRIGEVIGYRGKPPTFLTPQAVGAEIYQYKERLKQSAFEFAGISMLSAQSKKPGGLESAVALREYNDIETQRFAIQAIAYERSHLEVARMQVSVAKEIYGRTGKLVSAWKSKNLVERIDWSEVDLEEDAYLMDIEASSILSRTPAGRLQSVIEMSQAGLIERDEARRLMNHPDLQRTMDLRNAAIENIESTISRLRDGKFSPPEPYQNLPLGIQLVQADYLKARDEGAPEDVLELHRKWIALAERELSKLSMAMGGGPGAGVPPSSPPGAPPVAALAPQAMSLQPQ